MSARSALQNDAGTSQLDWHKSDTVRSPNVLPVSDWKSGRFKWLSAVRRDDRLSDAAQLLAVALTLDFAHHETAFCNPSIGTLSKHLRKCERTVQRAMLELRKALWINVWQATGRGNQNSRVTFLHGDGLAKVKGKNNVVNLSLGASESPTNSSDQEAESPTNLSSKPDKFVQPLYNKDKPVLNHSAGACARETAPTGVCDQVERPSPQCRKVAVENGEDEAEWNGWLSKRGFPTLRELGRRSSNAQGRGWDVPFRRPPSTDEKIAQSIAMKFFQWCAHRKGFAL